MEALDKLHKRLTQDGSPIRYVYEAGPTGFVRELAGFLWAAARTVDGLPVPIRPDSKATPTAKARTPVPHPRTTREYVLRPDKRFSKTPAAKTRT